MRRLPRWSISSRPSSTRNKPFGPDGREGHPWHSLPLPLTPVSPPPLPFKSRFRAGTGRPAEGFHSLCVAVFRAFLRHCCIGGPFRPQTQPVLETEPDVTSALARFPFGIGHVWQRVPASRHPRMVNQLRRLSWWQGEPGVPACSKRVDRGNPPLPAARSDPFVLKAEDGLGNGQVRINWKETALCGNCQLPLSRLSFSGSLQPWPLWLRE